jgi:hypothetical protein
MISHFKVYKGSDDELYKIFVFVFPNYIGGGVINLVFCWFFCLCVFLNKHSRCFILKIYHLGSSLIVQFIITAFIDLKVRNHCFGFR